MNTDIRINVGLLLHLKTKKLVKQLGKDAFYSLIALWIYAGMNHPDGNLSELKICDIEMAAEWEGKPGLFYKALKGSWLDVDGENKQLHDWDEHQAWACNAKKRSDDARKAVNTRWDKEKAKGNAGRIPPVYDENTDGNTPFLSSPFLTHPNLSKYKESVFLSSGEFEKIQKRFGDKIETAFEIYHNWKTNFKDRDSIKSDFANMEKQWLKKAVDEYEEPEIRGWYCPECNWYGLDPFPGKCPNCGMTYYQGCNMPRGWEEYNEKIKAESVKD